MRSPLKLFLILLATVPSLTATAAGGWPPEQDGLLFAFPDAFAPATVFQADGAALPGWQFTPRGYGRIRDDGALELGGGGFTAPEIGPSLHQGLAGEGDFTVLFTVQAASGAETGTILSLGQAEGDEEILVLQENKRLEIILANAPKRLVVLSDTREATKPFDVALVRTGQQAQVYRDGVEVDQCALPSDPLFTDACQLSLGAKSPDGAGWWGTINGIAIYTRALAPDVLRDLHEDGATRRRDEEKVPPILVRATLSGTSTVMTPEELAPYTQGLTVFLYEVEEVLSGEFDGTQLHVAHWTVLDSHPVPFAKTPEGTVMELALTPYDDNRQLAAENLSDDIVTDFSIPYFYDAGGRALRPTPPK